MTYKWSNNQTYILPGIFIFLSSFIGFVVSIILKKELYSLGLFTFGIIIGLLLILHYSLSWWVHEIIVALSDYEITVLKKIFNHYFIINNIITKKNNEIVFIMTDVSKKLFISISIYYIQKNKYNIIINKIRGDSQLYLKLLKTFLRFFNSSEKGYIIFENHLNKKIERKRKEMQNKKEQLS